MKSQKPIPPWARTALLGTAKPNTVEVARPPEDPAMPSDCLDCLGDLPLLVAKRLSLADCAAPMQHVMGCLSCAGARARFAHELAIARQEGCGDQLIRRWEATRTMWVKPNPKRRAAALKLAALLAADGEPDFLPFAVPGVGDGKASSNA